MPGIFISYRRADSPDATGRIYDRLVAEFGRAHVFKDVDSIPLGRDFRTHLNEIVGNCAAVLAIVGPNWTDMHDEAGKRRLEDADDFVRIELEAALARNIPVVPVLVSHAMQPAAAQLPASLAQLAYRQSIEVRPDPDFHHDATRLVSALRQIIDPTAAAVAPDVDAIARAGDAAQKEPRLRRGLKWAISIAAVAVAGMFAMLLPTLRHLREAPPPELRFDILTPATTNLTPFALSPDGRQIVFSAAGGGDSRLWLRSLASTTAQPLAGTEGATSPFWSPDSRSIGFFAGNALKRIDIGGGAPQMLTVSSNDRGGSWNKDGVILFAQGSDSAILRVPATGGKALPVTTRSPTESSHRWPYFLPDGNHFLYLVRGTPEESGIYLGALQGDSPVRLTASEKSGVYLPSGWLLWDRGGALVAQKLDIAKAELTGSPNTLAYDLDPSISRSAVTVASTGLIAYRSNAGSRSQLIWYDRSGAAHGAYGADSGNFAQPRLSPDGRRLLASRAGDYWLLDETRASRLTFDGGGGGAAWSQDGNRMAWRDASGFSWKSVSGAGAAQHLSVTSDGETKLYDWSADGRYLLFQVIDPVTAGDLWVAPTTGASPPAVLLKTPFNEHGGALSPDGRWVAYHSNESGRAEIYVRPFVPPGSAGAASGADADRWQVSTAGGVYPVWRRDGRELYYLNPASAMMAVPVATRGMTFEAGAPAELFRTRIMSGGVDILAYLRQYDVAPDGRFLINTLPEDTASASITVIQNWNPGR